MAKPDDTFTMTPRRSQWRSKTKPFRFENGLTLDHRCAYELLEEQKLLVLERAPDDQYHWVCDPRRDRLVARIHEWVWDFYHSHDRPRRRGFDVHHCDENKLNNTIENLELKLHEAHSKLHFQRKQKFGRGERLDLRGYYRPHAEDRGRVLGIAEVQKLVKKGKLRPPPASIEKVSSSPQEELKLAECALEEAFARLDNETVHLDDGRPIAKVNTRRKSGDVQLGLGKKGFRLACTLSEAALFRAWAKHRAACTAASEEGAVDAAAAADVGISISVFKKIKSRPSVAIHVERWLKGYHRLPPPSVRPGS